MQSLSPCSVCKQAFAALSVLDFVISSTDVDNKMWKLWTLQFILMY